MDNIRERLCSRVDNDSKHLTDVIFKTILNKMTSYVHVEKKTIFFIIHSDLLLLKLQICLIILTHPIYKVFLFHTNDLHTVQLFLSITNNYMLSNIYFYI